jgi:hypothetical protein
MSNSPSRPQFLWYRSGKGISWDPDLSVFIPRSTSSITDRRPDTRASIRPLGSERPLTARNQY